ncbi:recombination regulator RecX [Bacillus methanolicus PB1]|uniref:Regulatory protein RecX n=1 Tax=Bacillus methanolicus PB1 TaxID=997296 RepID=I3E6F1_BACMT|nr:recombination regulator RecX [Bacillus methanolicus]EIJ82072.1 recombination regulator RecX [Bacillus methanolicus PB1]
MAVITKITVQQKNQERYNIYMDFGKGEEYAFSVDKDTLIKFKLKKGFEVDPFLLTEIQYQDDIRKGYHLAINFLAKSMRSEGEVRNYLAEKEIDEPIIKEVILKLYEYKFLDDREYAKAYVRTQKNTTDKGTELIRKGLREKWIGENLIEEALNEYSSEEQIDTAVKVSEKFLSKNRLESERTLKLKLEQLLLRKGFSIDVIQAVLREVNFDKKEEEEMAAIRHHGEKLKRKYNKFTGYEFEQKMKQALYRKGFSIDLIEHYLSELELSDNKS